jgi:hypothetical protein
MNNADNKLQSSSCILQCEEGERDVGLEAVASSDSVARVGASGRASARLSKLDYWEDPGTGELSIE